jgi:hypothetical protein
VRETWNVLLWKRAEITITRIAPRKFDDDNCIAGCKPIRDGVADAFGLRDDDPRLGFWYAQERGKAKEYAIRITIEFYV